MPGFGKKSKAIIDTCHNDLRLICYEVIKNFDFSALEGKRSDKIQLVYFLQGKSKLDGINEKSKHQVTKEKPFSEAIDVAPYPIDFSDEDKAKARFYMLAGHFFQATAKLLEEGKITHSIRWGGDWDSDKDFKDQSFDDLPHFELFKLI